MKQQLYIDNFGTNPAANYQRFFVPSIGAPVARDLIAAADLAPDERVLDVACGTGVVTRLAAQRVDRTGSVSGLDMNPAMLEVARAETSPELAIDWHAASAESMPFADRSYDVAICQMGVQFFSNKLAALREMRRVLEAGGRAYVTVPGPTPPLFAHMADALARHVGPDAASFVDLVFSMHDAGQIRQLMLGAGFDEIDIRAEPKALRLPPPADFLWQYLLSTPLAKPVTGLGKDARVALERDVCAQWQGSVQGDFMALQVGMTTATASR